MVSGFSLIKKITYIFSILLSFLSISYAAGDKHALKGGWYLWDPYQYLDQGKGALILNGLDISLEKVIAKHTNYKIDFEPVAWKQHQQDLRDGTRDIAAGATETSARREYAYFSIPYREESNSLFTLKASKRKLHFEGVESFLKKVTKENFKLGIVDGFIYVDPKLNDFISDPKNAAYLVRVENTYSNLDNLMSGKIDGFLADRIDGATASWRSNNREQIEEQVIGTIPIKLMFSKKTVTPAIVSEFNAAIESVKASGEYDAILREYLFPVLLMQTIDRNWFIVIDIIGTVAFALSGLIIAYREQASFFKAALLATLPAVGGGIIRDLIAGRAPIGVLRTPIYIFVIMLTILVVYVFVRWAPSVMEFMRQKLQGNFLKIDQHSKRLTLLVDIFDALGLAAFTVIGVTVAFSSKCDPLWLWGPIFAVITGVGGGILRDLLRDEKNIWALRGEFYAEIPLIWGLLLTAYLTFDKKFASPEVIFDAVIFTLVGAFLSRILVIWFNIKPPKFRAYSGANVS